MLMSSSWLMPPRLVPEEVAQHSSVVRLPQFLSGEDITSLFGAADVVRQDLEREGRVGLHDLAYRQSSPKHTWTTVFLNDRLAELLPELHARLFAAAREVDSQQGWSLLGADRHTLSFRVIELHSVRPGGGLRQQKHFDHGSLITLDLMLSKPGEDFDGGQLQTLESDSSVLTHPFEQGDLVLFHSHKYHSVTPVTRGTRSVCVLEIWEGLPRRCPRRCTDPWGPCTCQFASKPPVYRPREGSEYFVPAAMLGLLREANGVGLV
jgi:hypothetical protein